MLPLVFGQAFFVYVLSIEHEAFISDNYNLTPTVDDILTVHQCEAGKAVFSLPPAVGRVCLLWNNIENSHHYLTSLLIITSPLIK